MAWVVRARRGCAAAERRIDRAGIDARRTSLSIPTGWAILALIAPFGGGWWWAQNMGGREPSEREWSAYRDAFELLRDHGDRAASPAQPLVRARHAPARRRRLRRDADALARADRKRIPPRRARARARAPRHAATASSPPRSTASSSGPCAKGRRRSRASARRWLIATAPVLLTITFVRLRRCGSLARAVRFARGGFGLRITAPFWGSYWREREYLADQYAARLGQAEELADFLEIHALIHDHPVPLIWLTEHTHPPTELRIDRLRKAGEQILAVAPGPEPVKAAPAGPPAAGPDGPALTEPDPSAERVTQVGRDGPADLRRGRRIDMSVGKPRGLIAGAPGGLRARAGRLLGRRGDHRGRGVHAAARRQGRRASCSGCRTRGCSRRRGWGGYPHHRLGHYVRFNPHDLESWLQETRSGPHVEGRRARIE